MGFSNYRVAAGGIEPHYPLDNYLHSGEMEHIE